MAATTWKELRNKSLQSLLDYTGSQPVESAVDRAACLQILIQVAGLGVLQEESRRAYQHGNPWPFTELQWGIVLTGEEYAGDDRERDEWDSERRGRFFVLEDYQRDVQQSIADPTIRQVVVKGASGTGKGASAGMTICSFFSCWDDAKCVLTRDTYETTVSTFLPEVVKWWKAMRMPPPYEWRSADVGPKWRFIRGANPKKDEGFSGLHGLHILFAFDEATAVPKSKWNMAETQATKLLALGNPRFSFGPFRDMFKPAANPDQCQTISTMSGRRRLITCRGMDASNVRMQRLNQPVAPPKGIEIEGRKYKPAEPIEPRHLRRVQVVVPGQIDLAKYQAITSNDDPAFVAYMGEGKFPGEDREFSLFPRLGMDLSVDWWVKWQALKARIWWRTSRSAAKGLERVLPVIAFGLDIARSEAGKGDVSCLSAGGRRGVRALHTCEMRDTIGVSRWALQVASDAYGIDLRKGVNAIAIDGVGVGGGVVDYLKNLGVLVVEVIGGAPANDKDKYLNRRAELYFALSERLSVKGGYFGWQWLPSNQRTPETQDRGLPFALPADPLLIEELQPIEKVYGGKNRDKMGVTPKEGDDVLEKNDDSPRTIRSLRSLLKRSPDRADACMYLMAAIENAPMDLNKWIDIL